MEIVRNDPAVENVVGFTGGAQRNSGQMFVALKPLSERHETADQVVARLRVRLSKEPGANLFLQPVQDIRIGGGKPTRNTSSRCRLTTWASCARGNPGSAQR